jgi:preprotein translocase subunit SecG
VTAFVTVLHIIVCFSLIAVILLQVGKGHGLSGGGLGDANPASSVFGTKTGTFFSKATTVVAIIFILTTIALDVLQANKSRSLFQSSSSELQGIDMEQMKGQLEKIKQEAVAGEEKARQISKTLDQKKALEAKAAASTSNSK